MEMMEQAPSTAPGGCSPAVAALAGARAIIEQTLRMDVPPGTDEAAAEEVAALWALADQIHHLALDRIGQLYTRGEVPRYSGYSTLAKWLTHHGAMPTARAKDLARLAHHTQADTLPATTQALNEGELVLGEAVAVVKATERAVQVRDEAQFPDEEAYRGLFESALVAGKRERPNLSANQIQSVARQISFRLDPHRLDRQHDQAHAGRGMSLHETFQGSYQLQAWGGAGDALIIRAAIQAFDTEVGEVGEDGTDTRSRSQREHDALIAALKFATSHTGCENTPGPLAQIRIVVPVETYLDDEGQEKPAQDEHGRVIPTGVLREWDSEAEIVRLLTSPVTGQVMDASTSRRVATARQRAAAFHGHTTCAHPGGCEVPIAYCQADHVQSFSQGGATVVANLQPLCGPHNRAKYQREQRQRARQRERQRSRDRSPGKDRDPRPPPRD